MESGLQQNYSYRFFILMVTPIYCIWTSQLLFPQIYGPPPPPPLPISKTSPGDTWPQSLVTNFLSRNPPQYKWNHHKQHLLITTIKISHYLPQLQFIKSKKNFHLKSACDYEFHAHPHPFLKHILFYSLQKI